MHARRGIVRLSGLMFSQPQERVREDCCARTESFSGPAKTIPSSVSLVLVTPLLSASLTNLLLSVAPIILVCSPPFNNKQNNNNNNTDLSGSENMVIPLACTPGSSQTLTVPEADTSYSWLGKPTSAQYYANNAGVSLEEGCTWGQPNQGKGNWSPVVIGAGYRDNKTWLSIAKNSLNSDPLNYNIKIVVSNGGKMNGECRYENGVFYGATSTNGCTVALESGSATYVLY
jgi:hypothetical protein